MPDNYQDPKIKVSSLYFSTVLKDESESWPQGALRGTLILRQSEPGGEGSGGRPGPRSRKLDRT
jgi:hypothetical protein